MKYFAIQAMGEEKIKFVQNEKLIGEARLMLEQNSFRYHMVAAWVGLSLNPFFAITDRYNIPEDWKMLLVIRLIVSAVTLTLILFRKRLKFDSVILVSVPFLLISLQNAFVYKSIGIEDLLGQNLNYMAMFIGAAMFVLWRWHYSIVILIISAIATTGFLAMNDTIDLSAFFVKGGLLLIATSVFSAVLIQTRYNLTMRTIIAQLELKESKLLLEAQAEKIRNMNENLETMIQERTKELKKKNEALEEYAFINSHKLRGPVATVLGLLNLFNYIDLKDEDREMIDHMSEATESLDKVVKDITKAIEKGYEI